MPDSEVSVKFSTKGEADLWKAFVKIAQEAGKAGGAGNDAAGGINKIDAEIRRFAGSIKQINATPLDRFNEKVEKLRAAFKAELLNPKEFKAGFDALQKELDASNVKKLTEEEQKAAEEAAKAAAETTRFADSVKKITATPLDRLNERMTKLRAAMSTGAITAPQAKAAESQFKLDFAKESLRDYQGVIPNVVRAQQLLVNENGKLAASTQAMGTTSKASWLATGVAAVASGTMIAQAAMRIGAEVKKVIADVRQLGQEAAKNMASTVKAQAPLSQLFNTKKEFQQAQKMADAMFSQGVVESRDQAVKTIQDLQSAGKLNEIGFFAKVQQTGVAQDVGALARSINAFQTSLGSQAGNTQQMASMLMAAGANAPEPDFTQFATASAKAGAAAKAQGGVSLPELLSSTAIVASSLNNSDAAGERMRALLNATQKKEGAFLKGMSLEQMLDELLKRGGGNIDSKNFGPRLGKILGSDEAGNAAQILLQNREKLRTDTAAIAAARDQNLSAQKMSWVQEDPRWKATIEERKAKAAASLDLERGKGVVTSVANQVEDRLIREAQAGRWGPAQKMFGAGGGAADFDAQLAKRVTQTQRFFLGDEEVLKQRLADTQAGLDEKRQIQGALRGGQRISRDLEVDSLNERRMLGIDRQPGTSVRVDDGGLRAAASDLRDAANAIRQAAEQSPTATTVAPDTSRRAQFQHAIPAE